MAKFRRTASRAAVASSMVLLSVLARGGDQSVPLQRIREFRHAQEQPLLHEFIDLLRIPNLATDNTNIRRNAEAVMAMLKRRGLEGRLLTSAASPDAPPVVYAQWRVPKAARTIVLYAHYDGQPVNTAEWATGPWEPTLRAGALADGAAIIAPDAVTDDTRVYARGAGDDKAGVLVILAAIQTLRALQLHPTDNLQIVIDGEEEAGSPHLEAILKDNRNLFGAGLWIICDGPVHPSGRNEVVYGVRGDMNVDLTVYGPNRPLHSGHYGNWAPNPAERLARLLTSMKDEHGRVAVQGWYDDVTPLGERERQAIAASAGYDAALRKELGLAATDTQQPLALAITEPSLNINGMRSGNIGEQATNMIAESATAVLDLRPVQGNEPQRQFNKLAGHLRTRGYYVIDRVPDAQERLAHPLIATLRMRPGAYAAARTSMDEPLARSIVETIRTTVSQPIVELPTSGGSLPLSIITATLGSHAIIVPIANFDDNQHAANENLRLRNLWEGIDLYAALLLHPASH